MMHSLRRILIWITGGLAASILMLVLNTRADLQSLPKTLTPDIASIERVQFLDRHGRPLTVTYQNRWNLHDYKPLHEIPLLLQQALIVSEDKRFYSHQGVDWLARIHALWQNLKAMQVVRGASTITEQVVRLLYPRPRTIWSRWLEGIEAARLERRFSKAQILEFYLNQVPYAHQRRGVAQAAYRYFDRELDTLDLNETLALAVLVRAPSRYDLYKGSELIAPPLRRLARGMVASGLLSMDDVAATDLNVFELTPKTFSVDAAHFVSYVRATSSLPIDDHGRSLTSLDAGLQSSIQSLLDARLHYLRQHNVSDGAVLVVDNLTGEILAWVNGGGLGSDEFGAHIDTVTLPRQPGSTLKPFLYALALEKGWSAATLMEDAPLKQRVGFGLHNFNNYSHHYYGPLRLREALANSLNTPAVRTMSFVNRETFLQHLQDLGFESLHKHPDYYGDGLALGNGEVTLMELVQAYATLARSGVYMPLNHTIEERDINDSKKHRVLSKQTSSIIADILSDSDARRLEFGRGNLLHFPIQTAVKTGTSNDYRDAWAVGFSSQHTVGVWMGNLDQTPMQGVSGSIGPALVLRSVFAELNRHTQPPALALSRTLQARRICRISGKIATSTCPSLVEWFQVDKQDENYCPLHTKNDSSTSGKHKFYPTPVLEPRIIQPNSGLQLASDPRIPDTLEAFPFKLSIDENPERIDWVVDDKIAASTSRGQKQFLWPLDRGQHTAYARIWTKGSARPIQTAKVIFAVK